MNQMEKNKDNKNNNNNSSNSLVFGRWPQTTTNKICFVSCKKRVAAARFRCRWKEKSLWCSCQRPFQGLVDCERFRQTNISLGSCHWKSGNTQSVIYLANSANECPFESLSSKQEVKSSLSYTTVLHSQHCANLLGCGCRTLFWENI